MKVGIDCRDLLAGSLNGIGRFVGNLIRAVSLEESPPTLYLYGNQHTCFDLPPSWGRPVRTHTRRKHEAAVWWWDRVTLPRMARRDRLAVFLSPYFKAPGIRSCPVVITIHDLLFLRMPPEVSGRSAMYCRAFKPLAAGFARRASAILTVSEHSQRDIVELLRVPKKKTHVVGNCVGPNYRVIEDEAAIAEAKRTCGIEGDYVLYVGNFGPHKNVDGLVRAFAAVDEGLRSRFRLVLAGRHDKWTPKVAAGAGRLGIAGRVAFTGHVPEEHLPALYAGASAFATLSRWEGFGLPALEAMACGTPVLCSDRTALPEVVGDAALLVDPDDEAACTESISRILTDDALRSELRTKGPARAARFSPEQFIGRILKALTKACGAG